MVYFDAPLTNGQTVVTLPFAYVIGNNELLVFRNGELLTTPGDYAETTTTTLTFVDSFLASEVLIVRRFGESSLTLDNLADVDVPAPTDCYVLTWNGPAGQWQAAPPDTGLITSANIINGKISVSFRSSCSITGITDLEFDVRDPTNTQVAASVPLIEYFGTGVYYGSVDVGTLNPGQHLVEVSSLSTVNADKKLFNVTPLQAQGSTNVIQEATRKFGDTFTFRHIAETALTDVKLTIYNASDVPIISNQPMVEIGSSGVFKYAFNPGSPGLYTGIMSSATLSSKSVTEIIFVTTTTSSGTTTTTISNRIGTGRREEC